MWIQISSCIGCGIKLQSSNPQLPGYLPEKAKTKALCQRCYRLNHYGELEATPLSKNEELAMAKEAIASAELVLGLIDPIDFAGTLIPELFKLAGKKLVVVLTKMDLLPPIAKDPEVVAWCRGELLKAEIIPRRIFP